MQTKAQLCLRQSRYHDSAHAFHSHVKLFFSGAEDIQLQEDKNVFDAGDTHNGSN